MITPNLHIPEEKLTAFCQHYGIRELALFGSAVTEHFSKQSDLDFLVEFLPQQQVGLLTLVRMQRELSDLFHRPVDLVPRGGLKQRLKNTVLSQAEVLYAA